MTQRQQYIKHLFQSVLIDQYVLLKFTDSNLLDIDQHSDLDILIDRQDYKRVKINIEKHPSVMKLKVASKASMKQLFIFFKDHSFLQVDLLFGFYRKSLEYMGRIEIMEHAYRNQEDILVCANHHLLEHVFLFQILNFSGVPSKYIKYFNDLGPEEKQRLEKYLFKKYNLIGSQLEQLEKYDRRNLLLVHNWLKIQPRNKGLSRVRKRLLYFADILQQIRSNRGFTITFSGVDGAGKSTIIREVREILEFKYRRDVVVLRHRPSILPILSAYKHGKAAAEQKAADTLPRQGGNKNSLSSLVRFGYYYTDYLLGQLYVKVKYHWRGYAVLYDRYYFDFIIDGRRSNIDLPAWMTTFLYRFVYHPPLNLFLYADAETIRQRKQELELESIVELTSEYKALFANLSKRNQGDQYVAVENIEKEKTLKTIIDQYLELI
jgi:thymidylate kinase